MKRGVRLIAEERVRQIEVEGWTPEHDDQHTAGELALAAVCYAMPAPRPLWVKRLWPWHFGWWKPTPEGGETCGFGREGRIRELVKAGALIAAEIDRLLRLEAQAATRDADEC